MIILRSCDIENCEEALEEKREIKKRGRTYCVAGALNGVGYKNDSHTSVISKHYFPKDVTVWPKWKRFTRRHRRDFTLQSGRPYAPSRLRRRLSRTHTTGQIRGT